MGPSPQEKAERARLEESCTPQFVLTDGTDGVAAEAYLQDEEETTESSLPPVRYAILSYTHACTDNGYRRPWGRKESKNPQYSRARGKPSM